MVCHDKAVMKKVKNLDYELSDYALVTYLQSFVRSINPVLEQPDGHSVI